jgi:hypothetical protein
MLIDLADLFQDVPHAIQIGDLPTDSGKLIGMKGDLAVLAAGIIHVQDPLEMTLTAGAGGAGNAGGMKGAAFEQRAAQEVIESRQLIEEVLECAAGCSLRHLYRCYTIHRICQYICCRNVWMDNLVHERQEKASTLGLIWIR